MSVLIYNLLVADGNRYQINVGDISIINASDTTPTKTLTVRDYNFKC